MTSAGRELKEEEDSGGNSNFFLNAFLNTYPLSCESFVLASDELRYIPSSLSRFAIIVNHDPSYRPGSHFSTIIKNERGIWYLDPLTLSRLDYSHIPQFLQRFKHLPYFELERAVQSESSSLCGLFALYFCYAHDERTQTLPFEPFHPTDLIENNCIVVRNLAKVLLHYDEQKNVA